MALRMELHVQANHVEAKQARQSQASIAPSRKRQRRRLSPKLS